MGKTNADGKILRQRVVFVVEVTRANRAVRHSFLRAVTTAGNVRVSLRVLADKSALLVALAVRARALLPPYPRMLRQQLARAL